MNSLALVAIFIVFLVSSEGAKLNVNQQAGNVVICQDPGTPKHAFREDNLKSFLSGMKVIFTCEYTYKLIGSSTRTCLSTGTWSGVQPICKKYMCDELEADAPKFGKRIGTNFTIGNVVTFVCSSNYKVKGEKQLTCLPNGEWSAKPPTCQHRCKNVTCGTGEKCQSVRKSTKCVCRDNMDCHSRLESLCGSDGRTYNNECIMKATACRTLQQIRKVRDGRCIPGDICSINPTSHCRAAFNVFYYDVDKKKCKNIISGGCHPSGWNGFWTKDDCKKHCIRDICAMDPDVGPCTKSQSRWYFDSTTQKCKQFRYGGCFGNPNNFRTESDCKKRCR